MENAAGGTCVKCGTPLQGGNAEMENPYQGANTAQSAYNANDPQSRPTVIGGIHPEADLKATRMVGGPANAEAAMLKQTVVQGRPQPSAPVMSDSGMKQTVVVGGRTTAQPMAQFNAPKTSADGQLHCPKCGYPVMDHFTSCPNCGEDFTGASEDEQAAEPAPAKAVKPEVRPTKDQVAGKPKEGPSIKKTVNIRELEKETSEELTLTCDKCKAEVPVDFKFCPHCGEPVRQKTLVGIRHRKAAAKVEEEPAEPVKTFCSLIVVPEEDEEQQPEASRYEGPEVVLNRSNTEPDNLTITSKEQAVLSFEDGKWYIENRSEMQSTLIVANRKIELQEGDIVLLGDRRFRFGVEE